MALCRVCRAEPAGLLLQGELEMQTVKNREPIGIHCILAMIYFIAIPLTITVNSAGDSFLKIITLPIGLFFLATLFFYEDKLELNVVHACFALYLISTVASLFVNDRDVAVSFVIGHIQNAGLMFCITLRRYNSREIEWLENVQIALLGILVCIGLFGDTTFTDTERTTMSLFGGVSDPNYFCGFFIFPIAVSLKKAAENKKYIGLCLPLIILGIYVVILSGSRGGLLAVGVTLVAFVVLYSRNIWRMIIALLILAASAVLFWTIVVPILPENIAERMSIESVIESRGTYRGDIWKSMLNEIKNSSWQWLTGRGINSEHVLMMGGRLETVVAHNGFIQTLYDQGVIGLLLFSGLSFSAIFRNIKKRTYIAVGMIGILTLTLGLTLNPSMKSFWNLIMYAGLAFTENSNPSKGDDVKNETAEVRSL